MQLAIWNVSAITHHTEIFKAFISVHNIDVMLIADMHFSEDNYFKHSDYANSHTCHTDETLRGDITNCFKHHQLAAVVKTSFKQLLCRERISWSLNHFGSLSFIHPRRKVRIIWKGFYVNLGSRFIGCGDYTDWGYRLIVPIGHELLKMMENSNYKHLFTEDQLYSKADRNKLREQVYFLVTGGIPKYFALAKSCFDISSNHY